MPTWLIDMLINDNWWLLARRAPKVCSMLGLSFGEPSYYRDIFVWHRVGVGFLEVGDFYRFTMIPREGNFYHFTPNSGADFYHFTHELRFCFGALRALSTHPSPSLPVSMPCLMCSDQPHSQLSFIPPVGQCRAQHLICVRDVLGVNCKTEVSKL